MTDSAAIPKLEITGSRQLTSWLAEQRLSLAFTTYQTGKIFLIGLKPDQQISVFERTFERCMGLCAHNNSLYMSTLYQLWRFNNVLETGQDANGYDALYVPHVSWVTGDVDAHDIAIDPQGKPIFINTLFSCLATISETHSFTPLWKPLFISKLAAEDRCHLNGLAMQNDQPKYVTAVSQTDIHEGWRDHRADGGIVIDIESNEIIAHHLAMPHSPRLYQDKLWLLNSGTGEFGTIDISNGKFIPVAFCPGYLRGLSFYSHFAIVGLSKPRENKTFTGLPLDQRLAEKNVQARCGLYIIDLRKGDIAHSLHIEGMVEELYDVVVLPGITRPMALGFKTDEIRRTISMGPTV